MNLQELQKEAHACAVDHGWHESDELDSDGHVTARQKLAWLALITDELDEAFLEPASAPTVYRDDNGKPCGHAVELADALIRILDAMSACGFAVVDMTELDHPVAVERARCKLVEQIRKGRDLDVDWSALLWTITRKAISQHGSERVDFALDVKMKYNRTRSRRHGGKLA